MSKLIIYFYLEREKGCALLSMFECKQKCFPYLLLVLCNMDVHMVPYGYVLAYMLAYTYVLCAFYLHILNLKLLNYISAHKYICQIFT